MSASSGLQEILLLLLLSLPSELPVCACVLWTFMGECGCLSATLAGSPVLPLPVELVAGGEGRPEPTELTGLGGSGRSGSCFAAEKEVLGWAVLGAEGEDEEAGLPIYMAERGRSRDFNAGLGGIGGCRAWTAGRARCGPRRGQRQG
jgi:hypothetical protein